eukprot:2074819-Prorocentrum_lima.AAC.1
MFAREFVLPEEQQLKGIILASKYSSVVDRARGLFMAIRRVERHIRHRREQNAEQYDRRVRRQINFDYNIGELVYVLVDRDRIDQGLQQHHKTVPRWSGPFPIVMRISRCEYIVGVGDRGHVRFHAVNLKRAQLTATPVVAIDESA